MAWSKKLRTIHVLVGFVGIGLLTAILLPLLLRADADQDQAAATPQAGVLRALDAVREANGNSGPFLRLQWLERHASALTLLANLAKRAAQDGAEAAWADFETGQLDRLLLRLGQSARASAQPPLPLLNALKTATAFAESPARAVAALPRTPPASVPALPGVMESTILGAWIAAGAGQPDLSAAFFDSRLNSSTGAAPARLGLAFLALRTGAAAAARAHLEAATAPLIEFGDRAALPLGSLRQQHHRLVAHALLIKGVTTGATRHIEQAIAVAENTRAFAFLHQDHWNLALLLRRAGDEAGAADAEFRAFVYAKTMRNSWQVVDRFNHLSRVLLLSGTPEQSVKGHREFLGLVTRAGSVGDRLGQSGNLALALIQADQSGDALETLMSALQKAADAETPVKDIAVARDQAALLLGWLLLDQDRPEDAWLALRPRASDTLGRSDSGAATTDPISAMMLLSTRARAAAALGFDEEACRAWTQAVDVLRIPDMPAEVVFGLEKAVLAPFRDAACRS